jgi:UDP-2,3-diacylglucosamine pyrophosphatase LpxH
MATTTIIQVSDIHFEGNEPENQGLVLNAFFKDLEITLGGISDKENTYCIISGDLVNKGNSRKIFDDFFDIFISQLTKYLPINHIFPIPGNHDFNRTVIEEDFAYYQEILFKEYQENEFNELIKNADNLLLKKFTFYEEFCKQKLKKTYFNIYGFSELITPELSVFCLNSALLSSGGYNDIDDAGKLKIETSELNKWIQENDGRKKILIMHHPIEHLSTFAQKELKAMLRNNSIDILIFGHNHDEELTNNHILNQKNHVKFSSPQLFSNKTDLNGYALLYFEDSTLIGIQYRQWSSRQRKFLSGQDFSGTEGGMIKFDRPHIILSDNTTQVLDREFQIAMRSYSKTPKWTQRILSTIPPHAISKENVEKLDYLNLINKPDNFQIIAAPQFGLTCYAKYLAKKAWEVKKDNWLYFDCADWRLSKIDSDINESLHLFNIQSNEVKCLLLDNWHNSIKDSSKILAKLRNQFKDIPFIILSNYDETIIIKGLDTEESHEGFKQLFLRELNRSGLRTIVKSFNDEQQIAEENCVLARLSLDLTDLNIHRTPLNCLQLLLAFQNNFEDRPVNRSRVFYYLLQLIFENPGKLFYGNTLDEKNCSFILGYFCEYLLRNDKDSFSESEFLNVIIPFKETNFNSSNISDLLQILKNNQILIDYYGNLKFRFSYWIYYFAAERMKLEPEFAQFMFEQKHSAYYPEIIEFYTGTDGARNDAAQIIIKDLETLSSRVHSKIGISDDINPFSDIKWKLIETKDGLTQEQLENNIRNSKLPDEIKDAIADTNYNSVKPYNQTIYSFLEEYDVKNLMELARSASRALRNSEFISPKLKENLSQEIYKAWKEIIRGLFLIAPILAKNGFGGIGGARFKLADDFPKEYSECLKSILINMPFNVVNWYKDDIFSDKIVLLFKKYLLKYEDPIVRHIIALLIANCRPQGWSDIILDYIGTVHKNSYYLGDLFSNLRANYSAQFMSASELGQTEKLIKTCWSKHDTGSKLPGKNTISKVSDNVLPERDIENIE